VELGEEACDDGNNVELDACSNLCVVQPLGSEANPGSSCKAILDAGDDDGDGNYWIDPDGVGGEAAFDTSCDMDDGGWTVLSHDREARSHRQGCEAPGCHNLPVTYNNPLTQITTLIDQHATECQQHILWECYGSGIWENQGGSQHTWWHDRNDTRVDDWPGGNTDACDTNDNNWRQNGGHVTDRNQLPVRRLRHGDTTAPEQGYHTLGKLRCR